MKLLSLLSILSITALTSCETCMSCTYQKHMGEDVTKESCGNSKEIKAFSEQIEEEATENRSEYNCIEYR